MLFQSGCSRVPTARSVACVSQDGYSVVVGQLEDLLCPQPDTFPMPFADFLALW